MPWSSSAAKAAAIRSVWWSCRRSKGIPAFHVETSDELELDKLTEYETVGVTAGASTPNWIIQQVVERLEQAQTRRPTGWKLVQRLLRFLTLTNLYVALGAAGLTLANMELLGQGFTPVYLLIAALYVFAVHTFNRLAEVKAGKLNDPNRSEFYQQHRGILQASALACGLGTIALSLSLGWGALALTTLMVVMGGLYQIDLVRGERANTLKYRRLKDIPTSKTLFVPLAWAVITSILPALSSATPVLWWQIGALSCMTFLLVFVRSALLDIRDIQGDRLVGKETIPIVLGTERTLQLLVGATAILGSALHRGASQRLAQPDACEFSAGRRVSVGGGLPDHPSAYRASFPERVVGGWNLPGLRRHRPGDHAHRLIGPVSCHTLLQGGSGLMSSAWRLMVSVVL